jgi:hypothetical protein
MSLLKKGLLNGAGTGVCLRYPMVVGELPALPRRGCPRSPHTKHAFLAPQAKPCEGTRGGYRATPSGVSAPDR